jgi:hypothetical protein
MIDWQQQEAGTAELEVLRVQLASTVHKASMAVSACEAAEKRAAEAEQARSIAESARIEAERLRREAEAAAHGSMLAAEQEKSTRAEAEGLTLTLKEEGERRARVFNNALRAAVHKVQAELEAERDGLKLELDECRAMLGECEDIP